MAMIAGIDCERGEKAHGYVAILELPQGPIFPPTRILRMATIASIDWGKREQHAVM